MNTSTYWMYTNDKGTLEFSSVPPQDNKLYIAVTPDFLRRMPIAVCEAPSGGTDNSNIYHIRGSLSSLYAEGSDTGLTMMMFIASQNSVDIDRDKEIQGETAYIFFEPEHTQYPFKTISDAGFERNICKGDIIANKVCFIRYNPLTKSIILINPSMDKEAFVSNLTVSGEANFDIAPKVRKEIVNPDGSRSFQYIKLLTADNYVELEQRLKKLEDKFIIGIKDPHEALEDAAEGSIYLKLGDILN